MRAKYPIAVYLVIKENDNLLMIRRYKTGYEDGKFSLVAGHVESCEQIADAAIRESLEEVGIIIERENLQLIHIMHRKAEEERIDIFFEVKEWKGDIKNCEPNKCDKIAWFKSNNLPKNTIEFIQFALNQIKMGVKYSRFGW